MQDSLRTVGSGHPGTGERRQMAARQVIRGALKRFPGASQEAFFLLEHATGVQGLNRAVVFARKGAEGP